MLEALPNPEPHPEYRWHTHEQCMFSIVAALTRNDYARRLWFCWTWEPESVRELPRPGQPDPAAADPRLNAACTHPGAIAARTWMPTNASRWGHCLAVECPRLAENCAEPQRNGFMLPCGCAGPPGRRASADAAYGGPADQPHRKKSEGGLEASESTLQRGIVRCLYSIIYI